MNKFFRATANIQLRKFIYSKLREASLWPITLTVFSNTPNNRFLQMCFNQVWSGSAIAPTASLIV